MANRVRRNCTDDSECVRARSEYSKYLLRAGYYISGIDNAFQNVQLTSQEILVGTTKENQVKLANAPSKQKYITSFHPHIVLLLVKYTKLFAKTLISS